MKASRPAVHGMTRRRMAFGRVESGPFGLRFAHARCDGIRVQAAADELLDRFAQLLAALVVAPVLPLAEIGVAVLGLGLV